MRNYLLASLAIHLTLTIVGSVVAQSLRKPPPAFSSLRVDLRSLELPRQAPEETPVTRPAPAEPLRPIPTPPPELAAKSPPVEIEEMAPQPAEDTLQKAALRPPEPDLPRAPEPPQAEPVREQDVDFGEPAEVEPVQPNENAESDVVAPREESASAAAGEVEAIPPREEVAEGATVQARASEGVDDFYLALVQRKIGRRWRPSPASAGGRSNVVAVVSFRIDAQGAVLAPVVTTSSGLSVFDRQALRAVLDSAPLPRPPVRFAKTGVLIRFHFVYNP